MSIATRREFGKVKTSYDNNCVIAVPDDVTIIIKPNRKEDENLPHCKKVVKPSKTEMLRERVAMAEELLPFTTDDSNSETGGFSITRY